MRKYYLDKFLVADISISEKKRFQLNIKRIGFTEIGFFLELTVWINKTMIKGILSVGYNTSSIKDLVELQELIPDIDMALSCNEEFEKECKNLANKFNKMNKLEFPEVEIDYDEF